MTASLLALVAALGLPVAALQEPDPATSAPPTMRARFAPAHPDPLPSAAPSDVVIRNSGSTNTAGYTIVVRPDATAVLAQNGTTAAKPIGKAMADALFSKLHAAGPVDELPTGHCMRSASFGSTTTITFDGRTSGDLGCGDDPSLSALHAAVARIADQVGATAFNVRFRHTL